MNKNNYKKLLFVDRMHNIYDLYIAKYIEDEAKCLIECSKFHDYLHYLFHRSNKLIIGGGYESYKFCHYHLNSFIRIDGDKFINEVFIDTKPIDTVIYPNFIMLDKDNNVLINTAKNYYTKCKIIIVYDKDDAIAFYNNILNSNNFHINSNIEWLGNGQDIKIGWYKLAYSNNDNMYHWIGL